MGDVVHYMKRICDQKTKCGEGLFFGVHTTSLFGKVTCPDCLEKLGVVKEVDEEKITFAKFIMRNEHDREEPCDECWMINETHGHGKDCIVKKAEAYLKSVKGE